MPVVNNDECSAYATLLLHTPWPQGGEHNLIHPELTAVIKLQTLISANHLLKYVAPMLQRQITSSIITATQGSTDAVYNEMTHNDEDMTPEYETVGIQSEESFQDYRIDTPVIDRTGLTERLATIRHTYYRNFISNAQADYIEKHTHENQIAAIEDSSSTCHASSLTVVKVDNYDERLLKLANDIQKLTPGHE